MNIKLSDKQLSSIKKIAQVAIDGAMDNLRRISDEDWGLGEMDEIDEVASVDKIEVVDITTTGGIKIYIDIYVNRPRYDFDYIVLAEISAYMDDYFPNSEVILNEIKDEREFGPGIDW